MESKHTATPWHATASSMGVHAYIESRIGGGMIQEIACCGPTIGDEGAAGNAEFIVRACNAHDDLVKALQEARQILDTLHYEHSGRAAAAIYSVISTCDAALAKAGAA